MQPERIQSLDQRSLEHLEENVRKMQEELQQLSVLKHSTETIVLDGSGVQINTALGFLCEHLEKLIANKSHRYHSMLRLIINGLQRMLKDTSQLAMEELSHKLTRSKTLQRRRPTQPIIVQWQLTGKRPVDPSFHRERGSQLKQPSRAAEMEILLNLPIGKVRVCVTQQKSIDANEHPSIATRLLFLPHPRLTIRGVTASIIPGLAPMISSFVIQPCKAPIFDHIGDRRLC